MLKFFQGKSAPNVPVAKVVEKNGTWADGPCELISQPETYLDCSAHYALHCANEMAFVHNAFFRGFNAVVLQGPHVPDSTSPNYSQKIVSDFMIFNRSLLRAIHHHHAGEEEVGFPAIEREIGIPGYMDVASKQHEAFHDGMEKLDKYVEETLVHPEDHRWADMKAIIDSFMPALVLHLREEVELFIKLKEFPEEGIKKAWLEMEKKAVEAGIAAFYDIFPVFYGCHDRTYQNGAGEKFPPAPHAVRLATMYWFGLRHKDAWRFCPCDGYSTPRPLIFNGGPDQPKE